jgi:hypothetical protein
MSYTPVVMPDSIRHPRDAQGPRRLARVAALARGCRIKSGMTVIWCAGLLLLVACDRAPPPPPTPGARLEAAAVQAGLVADPRGSSIVGSWARESDRVCVVPAGKTLRIGAIVDYGQGNGCAASGRVEGSGVTRRVTFGACRIDARYEGDRIVFPAVVPRECEDLCTGRASLAALTVERLSGSVSEASMLRTPRGKLLCGG